MVKSLGEVFVCEVGRRYDYPLRDEYEQFIAEVKETLTEKTDPSSGFFRKNFMEY